MSDYLPIENEGIRNYQMSGAKKITSERSSRVIFRPTNAIISFPHFHEGHNSIIHALKNPLKVDNVNCSLKIVCENDDKIWKTQPKNLGKYEE